MLRFFSLALLLSACDPEVDGASFDADTGLALRKGTFELLGNNQRICRFDDGTSQACCQGGATDPLYGVSCSFCGQNEAGAWICDDRWRSGTVTLNGAR